MCKYINGMVAGIIVGATVGMVVLPQLDRKTQKKIKSIGCKILDFADDPKGEFMDIIH